MTVDELHKQYEQLRDASAAEHDPTRKAALEERVNTAFDAWGKAADSLMQAHNDIHVSAPTDVAPSGTAAERAHAASQEFSGVASADPKGAFVPQTFSLGGEAAPPGGASVGYQAPAAPAAPTPSAAPVDPQANFPSFEEWRKLYGKGGGGGGMLKGALANAGAAHENADAATNAQYDAIRARAGAQAEGEKAVAGSYGDAATQLKAADADYKVRFEEHRQAAARVMDESRAATEDLKKIASERSFADVLGSSAGRIVGALSVALGSIGGGLSGQGGNVGMDVLKLRVDTDLRDRQERLRAKGAVTDQLDRLLQRNMDLMQNDAAARAATKAGIMDAMQVEVRRQAALSGSEDKRLAGEELIAGMKAEVARGYEAAANQQLLQARKNAAKGGKSAVEQYKDFQEAQKRDLEIQKLGGEVSKANNPDSGDDLGTVEGSRKAERMTKVAEALDAHDAVQQQAKDLLEKVGVPSVTTRAKAAAGIPLTSEENVQMSALNTFTKQIVKATEGSRPSDFDMANAMEKQIRQGLLVSQDALTAQIRHLWGVSEERRKSVLARDKPAAREYIKNRKALEGDSGGMGGVGNPGSGASPIGG